MSASGASASAAGHPQGRAQVTVHLELPLEPDRGADVPQDADDDARVAVQGGGGAVEGRQAEVDGQLGTVGVQRRASWVVVAERLARAGGQEPGEPARSASPETVRGPAR